MNVKKIFLLLVLFGCASAAFTQESNGSKDRSWIAPFKQDDLEVRLELIHNFDSIGSDYTIKWLIVDEFREENLINQYRGLHCYVRDASGEIARYVGDTWPINECSFQTFYGQVEIFFRIRSVRAEEPVDPSKTINDDQYDGEVIRQIPILSVAEQCDVSEFHPVKFKLKKKGKRWVYLSNDSRKFALYYHAKGATKNDILPYTFCDYTKVIHGKRWYVDLHTGRIMRGYQWINRRTYKKLCTQIELCLIDPEAEYVDSFGKVYLGIDLAKMRKIDLSTFPLQTWCLQTDVPY